MDDHGNVVDIFTFKDHHEARQLKMMLEARGHKQTYEIRDDRE